MTSKFINNFLVVKLDLEEFEGTNTEKKNTLYIGLDIIWVFHRGIYFTKYYGGGGNGRGGKILQLRFWGEK